MFVRRHEYSRAGVNLSSCILCVSVGGIINTMCTEPSCVGSLPLKVPAGSNSSSNGGRFFKESNLSLTLTQLPAEVSPYHRVTPPGQIGFSCQAGCHQENLTLSVSQENPSRNMNVRGLESKCQVSP